MYNPKITNSGKATKKDSPKILLDEYLKDISETTIATMPEKNIIYL